MSMHMILGAMFVGLIVMGTYLQSFIGHEQMMKRIVTYYEDNQTALHLTSKIINDVTMQGGISTLLMQVHETDPSLKTVTQYADALKGRLQVAMNKYQMKIIDVELLQFPAAKSKQVIIADTVQNTNLVSVKLGRVDGAASEFEFKVFLTK